MSVGDCYLSTEANSNLRGNLFWMDFENVKEKLETLNPVVDGMAIMRETHIQEETNVKHVSIYCGEVKNGLKHGRGVSKSQDETGDYYCGSWVDGKEEGFGEEQARCKDGNTCFYRGAYQAGEQCGKGAMAWDDGDRYKGEWKDNQQHGKGVFTYKNGDVYTGNFVFNSKHGHGVLHIKATGEYY
eukprot:gene29321-36348_t